MLAPHYKQGLERMCSDLARVTRLITPDPMGPDDIGSAEFAEQVNKSAFMNVANPWDEEDIIAAAVHNYDAPDLRPNRERVQKMTRGSQYKMCNFKFSWRAL